MQVRDYFTVDLFPNIYGKSIKLSVWRWMMRFLFLQKMSGKSIDLFIVFPYPEAFGYYRVVLLWKRYALLHVMVNRFFFREKQRVIISQVYPMHLYIRNIPKPANQRVYVPVHAGSVGCVGHIDKIEVNNGHNTYSKIVFLSVK